MPPASGLPNDNDTLYCPVNQTSCYFYYSDSITNASASSRCQALGGYLVSWNDAAEQLQVERWVPGLESQCSAVNHSWRSLCSLPHHALAGPEAR